MTWACKKCGGTTRYPKGGCKQCGRARAEKYRKASPERKRAQDRDYKRKVRRNTPEKQRGYWVKFRYGIEPEKYWSIVAGQGGKCKICDRLPDGKKTFLCVDHDHATGVVRGLICHHCNIILGFARDNPQTLAKLIEYLGAANEGE